MRQVFVGILWRRCRHRPNTVSYATYRD